MTPCVSIITVTHNAETHIAKSIESVLRQSYRSIEYIIVDGCSTDQTISIIESYGSKVTHFISEPDRGLYDAMNKGIRLSSGDWLYFLGADDLLASDDVIESIFQDDLTGYSLIGGSVINLGRGRHFVSSYSYRLLFRNTLSHQGTFYRRFLFENFSYDASTRVSGDYELNLKAYLERHKLKQSGHVIARCGDGGVSSQVLYRGYLEEIRIRNRYLTWPVASLLNLQTLVRFACKRFWFSRFWAARVPALGSAG